MVTTLEPKVQVTADPDVLPEDLRSGGGSLEWRYAMPFAGVRYYSFRTDPPAREVARPVRETLPEPLAVKLIDERVIVL